MWAPSRGTNSCFGRGFRAGFGFFFGDLEF
jgi:hypothetical protein